MSIKPNEKIRVIFMGTPEFAVPGLQSLIAAPEFAVIGVYTQPDKPVGRKQELTPPPIKVLAEKHNIPVFQPLKIRPEAENIRALKPDLIVVIAYGKIISQEILDIPTYGIINVHASLLPKYRGAACLNAPILNGDTETGVTIMKMEAGLDTGPILKQAKISLEGIETLENVHDALSELGAQILVPTLLDFIAGKITPQTQDDAQASYIKTLSKEDGRLDFTRSAIELERMVRAYNPWPGTWTEINGETLKIIAVGHEPAMVNKAKTGQLFIDGEHLLVRCGQNSLVILRLQLAGKKAMTAKEFINGNKAMITG